MEITIKESTKKEIEAIKADSKLREMYEAQLRVAVLGQLFLEAIEDYESNGGPKLKVGEKTSKIVNYIEKRIAPIYDAYYLTDKTEQKETLRSIEKMYEQTIFHVKNHHSINRLAYYTNLLTAIELEKDTMRATIHRILKKHKIKFIEI